MESNCEGRFERGKEWEFSGCHECSVLQVPLWGGEDYFTVDLNR